MGYITYNNIEDTRKEKVMEFEVIFYDKPDGTEPAKDFIMSLPESMNAKFLKILEILQKRGYNLREPFSKPLKDGIFELRAQVGNDISRVLYFFYVGKKVILTNGFIKKTQKTPQKEIDLALKYKNDYLKRVMK